jgi:3-hydroxyisobutyrate dehydrogenase-like beta-hydroxyacid dehydrogenase
MQVGFIGLGRMGSAMAANLLAAGHALTVYNRTAAKPEPLVSQGAHLAKTPGEAAQGAVAITMLADDHAVEDAVLGRDGILTALAPGAIHLSMSTISVALAERLAQYLDLLTNTLFGAPVYKTYGALIAEERYHPAGFKAELGYKDVRLALSAAQGLEVPMPLASLIADRFLALLAARGSDLDWSALALIAKRDAGGETPLGPSE